MKLIVLCLCLACLSARAASPDQVIRMALPPAQPVRHAESEGRRAAVLALYLRDRLDPMPEVVLVSPQRSGAILSELTSGIRTIPEKGLLRAFCEYVPVDCLLKLEDSGEGIAVIMHTPEGVVERGLRVEGQSLLALARETGRLIGSELGLSAGARRQLSHPTPGDPRAFGACYLSRLLQPRHPRSAGESRLKLLIPAFSRNRSNPRLCARILSSTDLVLREGKRGEDFAEKALDLSLVALPPVLGTRWEEQARPVLRRRPEVFEEELESLASPLRGEADLMELDDGGDPGMELTETPAMPGGADRSGDGAGVSIEQRAGALRLLALINPTKARPIAEAAAGHERDSVREAAATALAHGGRGRAEETLRRLSKDQNASVALAANSALVATGHEAPRLRSSARTVLAEESTPDVSAVEALARAATEEDTDLLLVLSRSGNPAVRLPAGRALARLESAPPDRYVEMLRDPLERVVQALLASFPREASPELLEEARQLANDPHGPVGRAARSALEPHRPGEERERLMFDLQVEHPYIRRRIIERLSQEQAAWARKALAQACENPDPHVRTFALRKLAERDPEGAMPHLLAAAGSSYRWVRLHAAALLAEPGMAGDAGRLRELLEAETDAATRLYLRDALARATGDPLPPRPTPARSVQGQKVKTWLCGHGRDVAGSPFDAYYNLNVDVGESWKRGWEAGKIMFGRVSTVGQPGLIAVNRTWRDRFWLALEDELPPENLAYVDGVVFGEETMSLRPGSLWEDGWRLFCREEDISTARIAGDAEKLNPVQRQAWRDWALERAIDGFNELYRYVHLRYGRLRPGIQVATFLPGQALHGTGPTPADRRWKFDVGGIYHYKGGNRNAAYNMVRRYRTVWPERPVIWLSLGIGGYEMNPVRRTQEFPESLIDTRGRRAWADTISAYAAGADPGWFSIWIFVRKDFDRQETGTMSGVPALVEDIGRDSPVLHRGIALAWRGAEEDYAPEVETPEADEVLDEPETEEVLPVLDAEAQEEKRKRRREEVARKIEEARADCVRGFGIYRKYVYDCARALRGLPRMDPESAVLVVRPGVSVWTRPRTAYPLVPGTAIPSTWDFLCDVNKCAEWDLSPYRLIILRGTRPVGQAARAAILRWLRDHDGILYVNPRIEPTAEGEWPWSGRVACEEPAAQKLRTHRLRTAAGNDLEVQAARRRCLYATDGEDVRPLLSSEEGPVAVLWSRPDEFRGRVIFDGMESASQEYVRFLRQTMNRLHREHEVGLPLGAPLLHQVGRSGSITAASCTPYYRTVSEKKAYEGLDLLTGHVDPVVGGGRSAALTAPGWRGPHAAGLNGYAVLCEKALEEIRAIGSGVLVRSRGLIRIASSEAEIAVTKRSGAELERLERNVEWILWGNREGFVVLEREQGDGTVIYVRSNDAIVCQPK